MPQPENLNFLLQAGGEKKISKLFYLKEVYWFHESKNSLTWCTIYGSILPDLSLIQSWLIQHMEGGKRVINVVFVSCEEKQRERSQDTRNETHYHSRDKRGTTWGTCFQVHACCFLMVPLTKRFVCVCVCTTGLTAFSRLMFVWFCLCCCTCVHVCIYQITKHLFDFELEYLYKVCF